MMLSVLTGEEESHLYQEANWPIKTITVFIVFFPPAD